MKRFRNRSAFLTMVAALVCVLACAPARVQALLASGTDVNAKTGDGDTALMAGSD
jgi:hypothetical protein